VPTRAEFTLNPAAESEKLRSHAPSSGAVATRVEVSVSWGSTVVQTLSCCPPRSVRVGDVDSAVPAARLGGAPLPLVVVSGGEIRLVVWPAAAGTVTLPGERARRLDRLLASGDASFCAEAGSMPTIPLPAGAIAEVALARDGAGASPYRAPARDDRLVFHVTVDEAPRRLRSRAAAVRYAAAAGLAFSVLGHFTVFATEPDPALTPTEDEGPAGPEPRDWRTVRLDVAIAEREGEGDWDRMRGPLDLTDDTWCNEVCFFCSFVGPLRPWHPAPPSIGLLGLHRHGFESEGASEIPRELTGCFARPAPPGAIELPGLVRLAAGPDPPAAASDRRPRRRLEEGQLWGFLAVNEDDPRPPWSELSMRAPRARRPRLAFGKAALEILTSGLERASSAFEWCYRRALEDDPTLRGHVAMRLGAAGSGAVEGAGTDVKNAELGCCLENAQRLWTSRMRGDGELRYVIELRP
jgi:hypothetical protein